MTRAIGAATVTFIVDVPVTEGMYGGNGVPVAELVARTALIKAAKAYYDNGESIEAARAAGAFDININVHP